MAEPTNLPDPARVEVAIVCRDLIEAGARLASVADRYGVACLASWADMLDALVGRLAEAAGLDAG